MATPPNNTTPARDAAAARAGNEPVTGGVWLSSRARRGLKVRDSASAEEEPLAPVRELLVGKPVFFFNLEPGRFTFDTEVVEHPNKAPPTGAELAAYRKADAEQRRRKELAAEELADSLPRPAREKPKRTPAEVLADRRREETGQRDSRDDKPRDPAAST